MDIRTPPTSPWGPGRRGGICDRILQKEIRWRPQKCDFRLPAPLVQISDALSTREAQPDSPRAPGSHTGRLRHVWFWRGGGRQRPSSRKVGVAHAERPPSTWVGALSNGAASDAPDLPGNLNRPFRAPRAHSPGRIALYPGHAPFWARRRARWNLGVRFRLIWAVSTRRAT